MFKGDTKFAKLLALLMTIGFIALFGFMMFGDL